MRAELRSFFGCDLHELPVVSRSFSTVELPNLQLAVDHFVDAPGTRSWVIGYTSAMGAFQNDLRSLIADNPHVGEAQTSAAQYREVDIDVDSQMQCVENGIHLINAPCGRVAAHVRSDMMKRGLELEVMASSTELATQFLEHVRVRISEANVFRGKIVSLECAADVPGRDGFGQIRFHKFPNVSRDEIILPPETLEMLERNTVRFFQHADALRRSGRSLKRGLLLHGKPG
ncbi:MAG TPA: hypothetical protein VK689_04375, partial [Armatimonadota bacterium]|nr:hypothetical protein [Armatimonadota bacterium]